MVLRIDGFNSPLSFLEGDSMAGNDSQVLLSNSEIDAISPLVAYWSEVAGSDLCDEPQASSDHVRSTDLGNRKVRRHR